MRAVRWCLAANVAMLAFNLVMLAVYVIDDRWWLVAAQFVWIGVGCFGTMLMVDILDRAVTR